MADESGFQLRKLGLRDTNLGATLRIALPKSAKLDGANSWTGQNTFTDLNVYNLTVYQSTLFLHSAVAISASVSSFFGTIDPQDMWFGASGIAAFGITSGQVYIFASSQPSSVFQSIIAQDTFNRANESPAAGWTIQTSHTSGLQVSANAAIGQAGNAALNCAYVTTTWSTTSAQEIQADISIAATANLHRIGIGLMMASSGPSGYMVLVQRGAGSTTIDIYKKTTATGVGTSLSTITSNAASAGTVKAIASAVGANMNISALVNGTYVGVGVDSAGTRYWAGYAGAFHSTDAGGYASAGAKLDNWQSGSTTGPPFSAGDIVLRTSASLYDLLGVTAAVKHAQVFSDALWLGFGGAVGFTGLTSGIYMSAGTSAFFNSATYGVVRLASGAGTTGLSGVIGFSATGGVTPSAVGNDLVWLKQDIFGLSATGTAVSGASGVVALSGVGLTVSAVAAGTIMLSAGTGGTAGGLWGFRNLVVENLGGFGSVSASANAYATADWFQLQDATQKTYQGSGLAVSANLTIGPSANGRDVAAAFALPSWLRLYIISGTNGVAGIWSSAVPSVGPVLPTGYGAWGLAATIYLRTTSALYDMLFHGAYGQYQNMPRALSNGQASAITAVSLSALVPSEAHHFYGYGISYGSPVSSTGIYYLQFQVPGSLVANVIIPAPNQVAGQGVDVRNTFPIPNKNQTVNYLWNPGHSQLGAYFDIEGFVVPNGAE